MRAVAKDSPINSRRYFGMGSPLLEPPQPIAQLHCTSPKDERRPELFRCQKDVTRVAQRGVRRFATRELIYVETSTLNDHHFGLSRARALRMAERTPFGTAS
jgi:hypothetical protein